RRYTMTCLTLGSAVRVDRLDPAEAGGTGSVHGTARAIGAHGRLVVDLEGGRSLTVDVGDVRHLRPGRRAGTAEGIPTVAQQEEKGTRSEEHTSELQSRFDLVCRLLLEKKKEA